MKFDTMQASAHWIPSKAALMFLFVSLSLRAVWQVGGARVLERMGVGESLALTK